MRSLTKLDIAQAEWKRVYKEVYGFNPQKDCPSTIAACEKDISEMKKEYESLVKDGLISRNIKSK